MRRNITKDQSIYHFCYFPIDLKGLAIGNKSYNTDHFNGENGKSHCLGMNYYVNFLEGHRQQWISHKMNIRHTGQLKIKILWAVSELPAKQHYQFDPFTNMGELAVLFSW